MNPISRKVLILVALITNHHQVSGLIVIVLDSSEENNGFKRGINFREPVIVDDISPEDCLHQNAQNISKDSEQTPLANTQIVKRAVTKKKQQR